ncbi:MAG: hypothetical protein AAGD38_14980 [Acidobacteriota bacterium]
MRSTRLLLVPLLLCLMGCQDFFDKQASEDRLHNILVNMDARNPGPDQQVAASMWYNGTYFAGGWEMDNAITGFDRWRQRGKIYPSLDTFEILKGEVITQEPYKVEWTARINGKIRKIIVTQGQPVEWLKDKRLTPAERLKAFPR